MSTNLAKKTQFKNIFNALYCCHGNRFSQENDYNLLFNNGAFDGAASDYR